MKKTKGIRTIVFWAGIAVGLSVLPVRGEDVVLSSAAAVPAISTASAPVPVAAVPSPIFVAVVPVVDLRSEPKEVDGAAALKGPYAQDPLEESQLLYGERVKILEDKVTWVRVEAVEQTEFTHDNVWEGYPGWVLKSSLAPEPADYRPDAVVSETYAKLTTAPSRREKGIMIPLGSRVAVTFQQGAWVRVRRPEGGDGWMQKSDLRFYSQMPSTDEARREAILKAAKLFLGEPYYWGGRAGHRDGDVSVPSGMDCSGLVNAAYRVAGVDVPRDAAEQYMKSAPLDAPSELKPGDLIFLSWAKEPSKITHVMIYAGGDNVVEAVQDQNTVRQVTVKEKLGKPLAETAVLTSVGGRFVYFGRLLPE